jgi:hypothetical protein
MSCTGKPVRDSWATVVIFLYTADVESVSVVMDD